jgi:hypothetical protein
VRPLRGAVGCQGPCSSIEILWRWPIRAPQGVQQYLASHDFPSGQRRFANSSVQASTAVRAGHAGIERAAVAAGQDQHPREFFRENLVAAVPAPALLDARPEDLALSIGASTRCLV